MTGMNFQWEDLIRISIGHDLVQAYTPKDTRGVLDILLGTAPPEQGSEIVPKIKELRKAMEADGIILPLIRIVESDGIKSDCFQITVALQTFYGSGKQYDLFDVLRHMVEEVQMDCQNKEDVYSVLLEGIHKFYSKKYQEAKECFQKAAFWSCLRTDCAVYYVQAVLGYGVIQMINSQYPNMLVSSEKACWIVDQEEFADPYLKYYTHRFSGTSLLLNNHTAEAIIHFRQACVDLQWTNECVLLTEVLFHIATAQIILQDYDACRQTLDNIYNLVKDNCIYSKEMINELYCFRATLSDMIISRQQNIIEHLISQYHDLSKGFLLKITDTFCLIVKDTLYSVISYCVDGVFHGVKIQNIIQNSSGNGQNILQLGTDS